MEWIEQLLHVSPDGGSGVTELMYALTAAIGLASAAVTVRLRRRTSRSRSGRR